MILPRRNAALLACLCSSIFVSLTVADGADVLIDNLDPPVTIEGEWISVDGSSDRIGIDYLVLRPRGTGSVRFEPELPQEGEYHVEAFWNSHKGARSRKVHYSVEHADGLNDLLMDQRINGGEWVSLGTYRFTKTGGAVVVQAEVTDNYVVADAVRFTPAAEVAE